MAGFTADEWQKIRDTLNTDPQRYGLPRRVYGSVVLASANIRKLGAKSKRDGHTWQFLADVYSHFDLLAVQEVLEDMEGLRHLEELMGDDFGMVVSDTTGSFPNEGGLAERLAFIFNWTIVNRKEMVTDVTFDRSKVLQVIAEEGDAIQEAVESAKKNKAYLKSLKSYERKLEKARTQGKRLPNKPKLPIKMPAFLTFIRTPFAVMFEIHGHPGAVRYTFMAVNAHLFYGNFIDDRRQEFNALMSWVMGRVQECDENRPLNILLMGDLNLDFDNPMNDHKRIKKLIDDLNREGGKEVNVYFPFLSPHPRRSGQQLMGRDGRPLQTNARMTETFDQIGFFSRDERLKSLQNADAGVAERGPDFGVFDFVNLFSEALHGKPFEQLAKAQQQELIKRFEHKVSDHMPLWFRIPLPDVEEGIASAV